MCGYFWLHCFLYIAGLWHGIVILFLMERCHVAAIENVFVINYLLLFFLCQVLCTHVENFKCSCPEVWKGAQSVFELFEPT